MIRRVPILVLALLVTAPLAAAPRPKEKEKPVPSIAGTSWTGKTLEGWDMTIDFAADGGMTVTYNGSSFKTASWTQTGEKVYYEMNHKYCEFNGKIADGVIEGETHNIKDKVWATRLTKVR
jgi:hypothetical protein